MRTSMVYRDSCVNRTLLAGGSVIQGLATSVGRSRTTCVVVDMIRNQLVSCISCSLAVVFRKVINTDRSLESMHFKVVAAYGKADVASRRKK
ncbi:hypothetical protein VTL71DRAFT_6362, partial [Oculimacula yallundae]